jgi:glycerol uptake facilitator-like aquaporin
MHINPAAVTFGFCPAGRHDTCKERTAHALAQCLGAILGASVGLYGL